MMAGKTSTIRGVFRLHSFIPGAAGNAGADCSGALQAAMGGTLLPPLHSCPILASRPGFHLDVLPLILRANGRIHSAPADNAAPADVDAVIRGRGGRTPCGITRGVSGGGVWDAPVPMDVFPEKGARGQAPMVEDRGMNGVRRPELSAGEYFSFYFIFSTGMTNPRHWSH